MPPAQSAIPANDPFHKPAHRAQAAAERWVSRKLGRIDHERRVAQIAATVFDLAAALHGLGRGADARLLRLACVVHDVGRSVSEADHAVDGAALLLSDTTLPLTTDERRHLAYLTLYHRGNVPAPGDDDVLHPDDDHPRLLKLLALLRCADGLDGRTLETPQLVFALIPTAQRPRLRVTCYVQAASEKLKRVYRRRKKFHLLEQTLGCRVEIELALAQGLRMVA